MKKAPTPYNEIQRLTELRSYKILDTLPEKYFDELVQLTSQICETPIALINLVDTHRVWVKSQVGLNGVSEMPRDISFCGHVIADKNLFVIEDARKDERFCDNPFVLNDPPVIFYAGVPLINSNNYSMGTLCIIDHQPKKLTPIQEKALQILGNQVTALFELFKNNQSIKSVCDKVKEQAELIEAYQEQSLHTAKMVSLGQVSAGIAHEINNPLSVISLAIQRIDKNLSSTPPQVDNVFPLLEKIHSTVRRIHKIIKSLKAISRQTSDDPMEPVSAQEIVDDALFICAEKFVFNQVELSAPPLPDVKILCRGSEVSQVLLNLITNAYDAVEDLPQKWVKVQFSYDDDFAIFSVIDSGTGIPKDKINKIMSPFYTSKPPGKGTGIGLSISKSLVEKHGGSLEVDQTSKNTKIDIKLPLKNASQNRISIDSQQALV